MNAALASLLARAAFMHCADPTGEVYQPRTVCINTPVWLTLASRHARAAFKHHATNGHSALKHNASLKELRAERLPLSCPWLNYPVM